MRIAALFSGGKDSVYSLGWAMKQGFEPILVTMEPQEYSMMFHHPNVKWTKMQAEAIGVEQVIVKTTHEKELADLENALLKLKKEKGIEALVTGAVESKYQKDRIDAIAKRLGLNAYAPMWHGGEQEKEALLKEILDNFEVYVTAVSAEGLDQSFLGKPFKKIVDAKIKNIHPFLEGGEGETFVTDAPFFKKRIEIKKWKISWDGIRGVAEIEDARLTNIS